MIRALKIIAGLALLVIVVGTFVEHSKQPAGRAEIGETWYAEEDTIGCRAREDLARLGSLANQNDREAALTLLLTKAGQGQCRIVKSGLPLYVETTDISGFPCVRPQGDPYCLHMAERQLRKLQ